MSKTMVVDFRIKKLNDRFETEKTKTNTMHVSLVDEHITNVDLVREQAKVMGEVVADHIMKVWFEEETQTEEPNWEV